MFINKHRVETIDEEPKSRKSFILSAFAVKYGDYCYLSADVVSILFETTAQFIGSWPDLFYSF